MLKYFSKQKQSLGNGSVSLQLRHMSYYDMMSALKSLKILQSYLKRVCCKNLFSLSLTFATEEVSQTFHAMSRNK